MDNLARGWGIVMAHWHGRPMAVWIAILIPSVTGVWLAIWAARSKQNEKDADDESLRPKQRPPLPRSGRGLRP